MKIPVSKLKHYHTVENDECPAFTGHFNFKVCLRVLTDEIWNVYLVTNKMPLLYLSESNRTY